MSLFVTPVDKLGDINHGLPRQKDAFDSTSELPCSTKLCKLFTAISVQRYVKYVGVCVCQSNGVDIQVLSRVHTIFALCVVGIELLSCCLAPNYRQ